MAVRLLRGMEDVVASGSQLVWTLAHQTFRRWYNRGLTPCRRFLEAWFGIGKCYQMTEGRQFQVNLLDGRKLELLVQPKLLSRDLLDLVASHFILKEKEYFGLCFTDDIGQNNWLQLDRKVLDHDFSKASGPLELNFLVRFYIDKFTFLKETTTVELFFLNAKSLVYKVSLTIFILLLIALCLFIFQESKGDYISNENARSDLKLLPVLPTRVLREHPSLNYCEDKVIEHYRKLKGLTRGEAIVQYLTLVESLPTYGVHYYPVKDKQEIPWWLGVSYKGIGQYDLQDKLKPRKLFQWKQLENLYFREKKFSVEVNDPHRKTVTKRTFGQTSLVIYTWYASHTLIKTIWVMAISQHQFYLDMKQSKSKMTTARSTGDIAMDLTEICHPQITKLSGSESKNHLIMASNGSLISAGSADSEVSEDQKKEKVAELKKKEKDLQEKLAKKLEELKKICLREAELTGQLPKEYPLAAGEKAPHVRRRVGTAFKLDDLFPYDEDPYLRNLESRFALQQKIVEAALKLSSEGDLAKTVKKKRKNNFLDAMRKLEEIEKEINAYRIKKGKKPTQRASLIIADLSSLSDSLTLDDGKCSTLLLLLLGSFACFMRLEDFNQAMFLISQKMSHDSPLKLASRQPRDARSMPPTPLLTRSAFSSTHLRCEDAPQHFRQRSGSLESQSQVATEAEARVPTLVFTPAQRSNSTEVLDDGSSYTSQSSVEYSAPGNHTHRRRARGRHRKNMYANTGSMPNLAQADARCYAYQPRGHPATTAYYVTGYPGYAEPDPYSNGLYMYENEMEGHYNVNASYNPPPAAYRHRDMHTHYGNDEMDSMTHNLYATLRPPRNRPVPRSNEQVSKNIQKAAVAEHLRGWYQRNTAHKQAAYNYEYYDRGPQQCLGYQTMHGYSRNTSYSSVSLAPSTGSWSHVNGGGGMLEYDVPPHAPQSYSYSKASYSHSTHNVSQMDPVSNHQLGSNPDPQDQIYWHENSKPGTIV
uniref:FERM domain containing 4B n=1 Tax=Takifugu rubripes TaxID=31033 RepID=A0A674MK49_TAKRU